MGKIIAKKEIPVARLVPYARNAKIHSPEQVSKIASSIQEFGFLNPVLVDPENNIIAGHGRVLAAQEMGLEKVPCVVIDGLTDEQRRAYILADNRLAELATWDMDILDEELSQLEHEGFDVELTGFDWDAATELEPIEEKYRDPADVLEPIEEKYRDPSDVLDPIEEKPEELKTRRGDVWELGDHRLMCGDSSDPEDMKKLFGDQQPKMVFTDPPYGVAIGSKNKELSEIVSGGVFRRTSWATPSLRMNYILSFGTP